MISITKRFISRGRSFQSLAVDGFTGAIGNTPLVCFFTLSDVCKISSSSWNKMGVNWAGTNLIGFKNGLSRSSSFANGALSLRKKLGLLPLPLARGAENLRSPLPGVLDGEPRPLPRPLIGEEPRLKLGAEDLFSNETSLTSQYDYGYDWKAYHHHIFATRSQARLNFYSEVYLCLLMVMFLVLDVAIRAWTPVVILYRLNHYNDCPEEVPSSKSRRALVHKR